MQIEIDFEVFKALTALRQSEADFYNAVVRRLLNLPIGNALAAFGPNHPVESAATQNALLGPRHQIWTSRNFPDLQKQGTSSHPKVPSMSWYVAISAGLGSTTFIFRRAQNFSLKGQTFYAEIKGNQWVGADGILRSSPSEAASAISQTNVNGWRFWHVQMPGDPAWRRLDELKA